jgi:Flp pilus assembly protein TadD
MPAECRQGRLDMVPGIGIVVNLGGGGRRTASQASVWRRVARLLAVPSLVLPLAAVALGGCEPFPVHLDPLSVNGRDGGGAPLSYDALMRVGTAARAGGDLANALGVFRRAAEIAPVAPAPFVAIGDTLLEIGAVNEAILAYNSALTRNGDDPAALLGLGRAYLETGRPELALVPLSKALAQSPNNPQLLLLIGVTKDLAGQHLAAQAAYQNGLKYAPTDAALIVNLSLSLALSNNYPAAIAELQPVAMAPAGTARERQSLALVYGLQGNDAEAARIGRIDLDQAAVEHNLSYYRILRELPPDALSRAILTAGASQPMAPAS